MYQESVEFCIRKYQNIIRKQMYLSNHGVPFSYTDTQSFMQLEEIIKVCKDVDEEMEKAMS